MDPDSYTLDARQTAAVDALIEMVAENWTDGFLPSLTCGEAERIADLLRAFGSLDAADAFIAGHSAHDEPGDLHHPDTKDDD